MSTGSTPIDYSYLENRPQRLCLCIAIRNPKGCSKQYRDSGIHHPHLDDKPSVIGSKYSVGIGMFLLGVVEKRS